MWPGQRPHVVGPRRISPSRRQGLPARRSLVHDPVPLVLPGAPRRGVLVPDERTRPRDVPVGEGVQSVRPLHQAQRAPEPRGPATVLRRPDRGILPGDPALVTARPGDHGIVTVTGWLRGLSTERAVASCVVTA